VSRPAAIVTGGRRGIGRAIALELARRGFDLLIADLDRDREAEEALAQASQAGARAAFVAADLGNLASHGAVVRAARDAFGRIDCLVNNAGIGAPVRGDLLDLEPENFDRVVAVNLRGTVFLSQAVARAMLEHPAAGARSIVTVTSVSAGLASPERADYCVSKAGLAMWVQALALRLAPEGIGVFDVRPGIIRTPMTAGVATAYDERIAGGLVPARRWGEPADVAGVVGALAAGEFAFATGSVIHVDGALSVPRL
jgi:NAD(P)-dependent dehydrogenase (short-subunit alcohol dehydrogenase family)